MLAKRIPVAVVVVIALALLNGCTPPGPRALLDGRRLLDEGDPAAATEKLRLATRLLSTNANAWNYLGLAYHQSGQATNAAPAYRKALELDRSLVEARFNLGCLLLEQNDVDSAKAEFTAYTLRRPNAAEGWIKLGFAQLRSREIAAAEKSFSEALRLDNRSANAFNGLGLAALERNRPRDAARFFGSALTQEPTHRAALLNLARVSQTSFNDPAGALRLYQTYLTIQPKPDDWAQVNALAQSLGRQLHAPPPPQPTPPQPQQQPAAKPEPPARTEPALVAETPANVRTQAPPSRPTPPPQRTEVARATPQRTPPPAETPMEVVNVPPDPVIRMQPGNVQPPVAQPPPTQTVASRRAEAVPDAEPAESEKRGFLQRMNPVNLFRREPKPETTTTPLPPSVSTEQASLKTNVAPAASAPVNHTPIELSRSKLQSIARYRYVSPSKPAAGNRAEAERHFTRATKAREAKRPAEALDEFRQAAQADPSWFDAQFSLALAQFQSKDYAKSLVSWENALALDPDSADARYNFALTLKAANFPLEAARELERIVASKADVRSHLALANLCAEQFQDTARARAHYLKVLELAPNHPQAGAIRYWLVANPQ